MIISNVIKCISKKGIWNKYLFKKGKNYVKLIFKKIFWNEYYFFKKLIEIYWNLLEFAIGNMRKAEPKGGIKYVKRNVELKEIRKIIDQNWGAKYCFLSI